MRWRREYLSELKYSHRLSSKAYNGDGSANVAIVHDDNHPRLLWKLGKVKGLLVSHDRVVRGALVRVKSGTRFVVLKRPVRFLYLLEIHGCAEDTGASKEDTIKRTRGREISCF